MKRVLGFILVLALFGCEEDDQARFFVKDDPEISTLNGTWKVISFEDQVTKEITTPTEENSWGLEIVVTFDDSTAPYSISGKNTSNQIFGEFTYQSERSFKVAQLGSTFVNQPEWGDKFSLAVLDGVMEFKINSSHLRIFYESSQKSMTLEKQ